MSGAAPRGGPFAFCRTNPAALPLLTQILECILPSNEEPEEQGTSSLFGGGHRIDADAGDRLALGPYRLPRVLHDG